MIVTVYISKLLYSWLFIGPSEHHHTTQTSKFKNKLNGASTMLNNVFKFLVLVCSYTGGVDKRRVLGSLDIPGSISESSYTKDKSNALSNLFLLFVTVSTEWKVFTFRFKPNQNMFLFQLLFHLLLRVLLIVLDEFNTSSKLN